MADWRKCRLGELLEIKHGFAFKGEHFTSAGDYVLLTPGNFREEGGLKLKGDKEKFYSANFPDEYLLQEGDLVVAMTDLTQEAPILGSSARIPQGGRFLHNQRLGKIVNLKTEHVLAEYVYYLFNAPFVRAQVKASATGATVRHTAPTRIYDVGALLPPVPIQRRIASILSAYDELIENSRRRIWILESMADALYREWFVRFRFPNHESVSRVQSPLGMIPEGWEVRKLGDVAELKYGKALKKEDRREGDYPVYGSSGVVGTHDAALVEGPGIVVGRKGNVGSVFWSDGDFFVIDTAYFVTSSLPLRFLYYVLPTLNFVNGDAAVPGLSRNQAYALELLVPPTSLLEEFCRLAGAFARQASALGSQVQNLRRTRDLLLPRLLSGQVDVETIDL
jgi:type I restriction enzyme S subunit